MMFDKIITSARDFLTKAVALITAGIIFLPSLVSQGMAQRDDSVRIQAEHVSALEAYYKSGSYVPVNESSFTAFDLEKAYADGVKFNEVSFIATHNSYQTAGTPAMKSLYEGLSKLTFGLVYKDYGRFTNDFITDQLELGIRSLEIDLEVNIQDGKTQFICCHSPVLDMGSTCYDMALAMKEIKLWSDNNPGHLPITIIIEPKKFYCPMDNLTPFSLKYAREFDAFLKESLGDMLMTPADMLGDYASFADMRAADGWPTLKETTGKVMVLLHDTTVSGAYIRQDEAIRTQAMFPMVRYSGVDKPYASFVLLNKVSDAIKYSEEVVKEKKCVVRTRVDSISDRQEDTLGTILQSGVQILSTDHPLKKDKIQTGYYVSFEDGQTVNICG